MHNGIARRRERYELVGSDVLELIRYQWEYFADQFRDGWDLVGRVEELGESLARMVQDGRLPDGVNAEAVAKKCEDLAPGWIYGVGGSEGVRGVDLIESWLEKEPGEVHLTSAEYLEAVDYFSSRLVVEQVEGFRLLPAAEMLGTGLVLAFIGEVLARSKRRMVYKRLRHRDTRRALELLSDIYVQSLGALMDLEDERHEAAKDFVDFLGMVSSSLELDLGWSLSFALQLMEVAGRQFVVDGVARNVNAVEFVRRLKRCESMLEEDGDGGDSGWYGWLAARVEQALSVESDLRFFRARELQELMPSTERLTRAELDEKIAEVRALLEEVRENEQSLGAKAVVLGKKVFSGSFGGLKVRGLDVVPDYEMELLISGVFVEAGEGDVFKMLTFIVDISQENPDVVFDVVDEAEVSLALKQGAVECVLGALRSTLQWQEALMAEKAGGEVERRVIPQQPESGLPERPAKTDVAGLSKKRQGRAVSESKQEELYVEPVGLKEEVIESRRRPKIVDPEGILDKDKRVSRQLQNAVRVYNQGGGRCRKWEVGRGGDRREVITIRAARKYDIAAEIIEEAGVRQARVLAVYHVTETKRALARL